MMNKILLALVVILVFGCAGGLYAVKKYYSAKRQISALKTDLRRSGEAMEQLTELLGSRCPTKAIFLHHSVGRNILYAGGLQRLLIERGVFLAGATYGDEIGQSTDVLDWGPKFRDEMNKILTFKSHPDRYHEDGTRNQIVMFKSCYPNSNIVDHTSLTADEAAGARTLANYKATFNELKRDMMAQESTLFVYLTAPPLVAVKTTPENALRAREFNEWLINEFLVEYQNESSADNFAVFDLFDFLAGPDNLLKEAYREENPADSHPNDEASRLAAEAFVDFLVPVWEDWQRRKGDEAL